MGSAQEIAHSTTRLFWPPLSLVIGCHACWFSMPKRPSRERISTSLAPVHAACTRRACGVHAACTRRACGVHAACMHAVRRRTGELGGQEVLRRRVEVELVDVVLREYGPLGAAVEPRLAARGLKLLREKVQESRLARAVGPGWHEGSTRGARSVRASAVASRRAALVLALSWPRDVGEGRR